MKSIDKSYFIAAPVTAVWRALVDPGTIDEWGGGPAKMNDRKDTEFELWGGDIHGKNIAVEPWKRLVQEWYSGDWPEPSFAEFTLSEEPGGTRLDLHHTDVPDDERDDIAQGWDDYYLAPTKELLEGNQ